MNAKPSDVEYGNSVELHRQRLLRNKTRTIALKRTFDVLFAFLLLVITLPIIVIAVIAIRITSNGPAIFVQKRLGQGGRIFNIYKLRTMTFNHDGGLSVVASDPHVTPVGAVLRSMHLDELPQLLNVIRGDMSIVGPRPALPFHYDYYSKWEYARLVVRPGITGLSQVTLGNAANWDERISVDVTYVENLSISEDVRILVLTVKDILLKALGKKSTYKAEQAIWTRGFPANPFTNSRYERKCK